MKVLLIDNYAAPYRVNLYNQIAQEVDLTVVYGVKNDKTRDEQYKNENVQFHTLFLEGIRVGSTANLTFKIKKVIKKGNFDVIIVGGYDSPMSMIAMMYMKRHHIPFILNADGGFINESESKFKKKLKTYFISMASEWITSGKFTDRYLTYYGAKKDKIHYYPFAFNFKSERHLPSADEKQKKKEEIGVKEDKAIFFVGRAIPVKRLDIILKAFSNVKGNVGLYIVGVDSLPEEYYAIIKARNMKNVHLMGFKMGQDLKNCYLAGDAFVLFSKYEVWGLVINEAMTNGCPVIASDNCIAAIENIEDMKNGLIVENGNEAELTQKMQLILDDDKLRADIARNEYEFMKDFNLENNAKAYIEIIKNFYNNNNK